MLFDCIISQLIVKGILKTHLDFLSINEFFSKITPSLFTIKEGSTSFPEPLFSWRRLAALGKVQASLTLLSFAQPFPSGDRGCANRPTRCSNRFAIWLADHQRSSPAAELRFAVCDRMDTNRLGAVVLTPLTSEHMKLE